MLQISVEKSYWLNQFLQEKPQQQLYTKAQQHLKTVAQRKCRNLVKLTHRKGFGSQMEWEQD
jgi:hypothetical protein